MNDAEMMIILILFHSGGFRCFRHYYNEYVCKHLTHLFRRLVSYNCFVELEKDILLPLTIFIKQVLLGTPFLVAVLVVLVTARFWYAQSSILLELFIILLSVYLLIIFILWCFTAIYKRKQNDECKRNESRKKAAKNNQTYEQIWNFFLGLSNQRMQILFELIKLPEAGSKYKRVVQPKTKLKNQLACDDSFKIRINFNWYLPLLMISSTMSLMN